MIIVILHSQTNQADIPPPLVEIKAHATAHTEVKVGEESVLRHI